MTDITPPETFVDQFFKHLDLDHREEINDIIELMRIKLMVDNVKQLSEVLHDYDIEDLLNRIHTDQMATLYKIAFRKKEPK